MNDSLYDLNRTLILHYKDGSSRTTTAHSPHGRKLLKKDRAEMYPEGTRIQLVALAQTPGGYDDRPNLPPGSFGIVTGEPDDASSLPVRWDNGASLAATADDWIAPV